MILVDTIVMKILLERWAVIKGTRGIQVLVNVNVTCGVNKDNILTINIVFVKIN